MNQQYHVLLTETERYQLKHLVSSGTAPARKLRRAQILLQSDSSVDGPNGSYQAICEAFDVSQPTVSEVRRADVDGGLEAALNRKPPEREYQHRLDGEGEAHLIALACSHPPEGHNRWTLRRFKRRFIQLGYVEHLSHETIGTTLKKMNSSRGGKHSGAFRRRPVLSLSAAWKTCSMCTRSRTLQSDHWCAWTKPINSASPTTKQRCWPNRER